MNDNPKPKRNWGKKIFAAIALVLALLGIDHYTWHWVSGGVDVTVTDSTVVVAPATDTAKAAVIDTTKKDSVPPQ